MGKFGNIIFILALVYVVYILVKRRGNFSYNKGVKLINSKNYNDGLICLDKALEKGLKPMQEIGIAYAEIKYGDIKKAEKKINMVLLNNSLKPNDRNEARCVMSILYVAQGKIKDAAELLEKIHPDFISTKFYSTYGYVAVATGDLEYAKKANEEAYAYNSDSPVICDNYALYLYETGEYEKACEIYEKITQEELKFPEGYYNYALVLNKLNDNEKAKEMLEKALTMEYFGITTVKKQTVQAFYNDIAT